MSQLLPYLHFKGNCREAMTFYQSCVGGELTLQTVGDSPMAAGMPPETHANILHSSLTKNGALVLLASDMLGPGEADQGNTVTLCIICETKEEIQTVFKTLGEGGVIGRPLKEEFFGTFGDLVDKFGMRWMFQFEAAK